MSAQQSDDYPTPGTALITAERQRQIDAEGWTPEHDDEHNAAELAIAAGCYLMEAVGLINGVEWAEDEPEIPHGWPWHDDWWKPGGDPIRTLVKAGALIAAEIDRLTRGATEVDHGPCGRCGKDPAEGFASIDEVPYCHPDSGVSCYLATVIEQEEGDD